MAEPQIRRLGHLTSLDECIMCKPGWSLARFRIADHRERGDSPRLSVIARSPVAVGETSVAGPYALVRSSLQSLDGMDLS
jgi:hypothetical protein